MQHHKNHARYSVPYHMILLPLALAVVIGSVVNLFTSNHENLYSASLICLLSIIVFFLMFFARGFALKAQDRAIRAEENFRHYLHTNNPLDNRLKMSQIVALRFASDDEFAALAQKAVENNLSNKEIKQLIKNWKADNDRV